MPLRIVRAMMSGLQRGREFTSQEQLGGASRPDRLGVRAALAGVLQMTRGPRGCLSWLCKAVLRRHPSQKNKRIKGASLLRIGEKKNTSRRAAWPPTEDEVQGMFAYTLELKATRVKSGTIAVEALVEAK
jgi:hypothetical protein